MRTILVAIFLTTCLAATSLAQAEESKPGGVVGARLGVFLPQVSSELSTHVITTLEGGYVLFAWEGRLQLFGSLAYTQPERTETRRDNRLPEAPGGEYDFTTIQRELTFDAGLLLRFLPLGSRFNGYAMLGPRLTCWRPKPTGKPAVRSSAPTSSIPPRSASSSAWEARWCWGPGGSCCSWPFPTRNCSTSSPATCPPGP